MTLNKKTYYNGESKLLVKPAGTVAMSTKKKTNPTNQQCYVNVNLAIFEYLKAHNLNIKFTISKVLLEGTCL